MNRKISGILQRESIRTRLAAAIMAMLAITLCINLLIYRQINSAVGRIDAVFASNVEVNDLSDTLSLIQNRVEEYLITKSS
ncbi:MAG: histidine kinase, partial [Blautia sp.]|nr:histidine kinase [Blautia sp.]